MVCTRFHTLAGHLSYCSWCNMWLVLQQLQRLLCALRLPPAASLSAHNTLIYAMLCFVERGGQPSGPWPMLVCFGGVVCWYILGVLIGHLQSTNCHAWGCQYLRNVGLLWQRFRACWIENAVMCSLRPCLDFCACEGYAQVCWPLASAEERPTGCWIMGRQR